MSWTLLRFWISLVRQLTLAARDYAGLWSVWVPSEQSSLWHFSEPWCAASRDSASGQRDKVTSQCFVEWEEVDLSSTDKHFYSLDFVLQKLLCCFPESAACTCFSFVHKTWRTLQPNHLKFLFLETCNLHHTWAKKTQDLTWLPQSPTACSTQWRKR